ELHDRPHRGGLPGAVRTEEADELTRSHLERHTVEGDDRAEALRDAADLQHDEPTLTAHTHGPRGAGQVRSWRMRTRGNPSSTESVSATFTKPSCSNRARVPTYAIVRSTFSPPLSTGYPSSAGAPESRAKSIAPRSRWWEIPLPRCPGRTRMHHTDHTSRSSTCRIFRFPAKLVAARGATPAQPTTSSPS